jgi:hypothetical protein
VSIKRKPQPGDPPEWSFKTVNAPVEMLGQRFGRLEVIEEWPEREHAMVVWVCVCDCGELRIVRGSNLRQGKQVSCGCYEREAASQRLSERHQRRREERRRAQDSADPMNYLFDRRQGERRDASA